MRTVRSVVLFSVAALAVVGLEAGCALVLSNGGPGEPLGFKPWFGGLAVAAPIYLCWMYRQTIGRGP